MPGRRFHALHGIAIPVGFACYHNGIGNAVEVVASCAAVLSMAAKYCAGQLNAAIGISGILPLRLTGF